jgi:three-Cys-motif partner protein
VIDSSAKTDMLEHSKAKVALYSYYLSTFISIMRHVSYIKEIFLFDLFAGEGKYENGSKGSPLIACDVINEQYHSSAVPKITMWFNDNGVSMIEPEIKKIDRVKRFVSECSLPENVFVSYFNEDYDFLWPKALNKVKDSNIVKGLFFIDPYGYKDINPDDLKEIICAGNTEIILFVPASHMYRFAAKASICDFPGGAPLRELLCKIYDGKVPVFSSVHDFIDKFCDQLNLYIGNQYFVEEFRIERDHTNVYCLIFITSNELGCEKMLAAKWKQDPNVGSGYRIEKTTPLFNILELSNYKDKVQKFILNCKYRTNHELYRFGLRNGFLPKHTNKVLKSLMESKLITRISLDGKEARGNYLCYNSERTIGFKSIIS